MLEAPKRIRLDPSVPWFWRQDGTLQLGFPDVPEGQALVIREHPREVATWLRLWDGSQDGNSLQASALAMGIPEATARGVMTKLLRAGHAFEVETLTAARAVAGIFRDLHFAAGLGGLGLSELVMARGGRRVLVTGAGALAYRLHRGLQRAQADCGWQPEHPSRIRPEDAGADIPRHAVGRPWRELAVPVTQPHLVVAIADAFDLEELSRRFGSSLLLPVVIHKRRIAVGPLLHCRGGITAAELHARRVEAEPDWNLALIQLLHQPRPLPVVGDPWLGAAEHMLLGLTLEILSGAAPPELLGCSLELLPPASLWRMRDWSAQSA